MRTSRIELCVLIALIFCMALRMFSFGSECENIRGKVLRLHVIANSDALCDQTLKLRVRDRILECSDNVFSGCSDLDDALISAEEKLPELEAAALDELRRCGSDCCVKVSLCRDRFPTRTYSGTGDKGGSYTLPAGLYDALRIEIGKARGHNWWCVMFPMVCVPSSEGSTPDEVFTAEELEVVHCDGYDLRFACVEWYEKLRSRLE